MLFTEEEIQNPKKTIAYRKLRFPLIHINASIMLIAAHCVILGTSSPLPPSVKGLFQSLAIGASVNLSGVAYGIMNDMFACRNNIEYFTHGHHIGQDYGLVKTDDPNANAVAWGILATNFLSLPAGIIFAITSLISFYAGNVQIPPFLIACLPAGCFFTGVAADLISRYKQNQINPEVLDHYLLEEAHSFKTNIATYSGNNTRNNIGYFVLPLLGFFLLVGSIIINALAAKDKIKLPSNFLMSLQLEITAMALPAVIVLIGEIYLAAMCHYLSRNVSRQLEQFKTFYMVYPSNRQEVNDNNLTANAVRSPLI